MVQTEGEYLDGYVKLFHNRVYIPIYTVKE